MADITDLGFKIDNDTLDTLSKSIENVNLMNNGLRNQMESANRMATEIANQKYREKQEAIAREEKQIELLEDIKHNTSFLPDMMKLLSENNEYQKEILEYMNELSSIATIKDKEEATSTYRKVMNNIKTVISDVNTFTTIWAYGVAIGQMLSSLGIIDIK